MTNYWTIFLLRLFLCLFLCSLTNCTSITLGPRGIRYKNGGAYIGVNPSMSTDNEKIVFGSTRYGIGDICIVNNDGTNWARLTNTPEYEGEPSFSPDGRKIVFVSERDGNGEIYIMNSDGSNQARLTHSQYYDANPSFSPDGSQIVFVRNIPDKKTGILYSHIFIMNSNGEQIKRITYGDAWYSGPSFSPDGRRIIYKKVWQGEDEGIGIGLIDVDGSNEIRIKKCFCYYPSFSPNGKNIIFVADWHDVGEYELWTMTLDSYVFKRIPLPKNIDIFYPIYVNRGAKILFLNMVNEKGGQTCIINEDGTDFNVISNTY